MRNKLPFVLSVLSVSVLASAAEWEDPSVNSLNRLPPRTYSMPLADESAALTDALEPETPFKKSLNGTWKLSWAGNPDLRVKGFEQVGFDDSDWFDVEVPSCVELSGFGSPGYTNVRYPHANLSHPTNAAFATIRDRQSGKPDYNPVSSYRTRFTVPESWKDRRVILRFDGVYSAYYVWVNGKRVGYAEDSKLPSEFDITSYLNFSTSQQSQPLNLLCVEVYRWCDGSYLEDQDMTRFSGIFRDVTLWAMPKDGIWDFAVRTTRGKGEARKDQGEKWSLEIEGIDGEWTATLYDAVFKPIANLSNLSNVSNLSNISLWSAEKPCLYTLVVKKGDDVRMRRIGFKDQRIVGNAILVNGRKVKFKGVNRHETSPLRGRSVTLDDMVRDITLMKRYNVNMVRTTHYPDHHLWYDLCDRYGIYLCAEANVEGHEPGYREKGLGQFPAWAHTIVERNERHVRFYRNHPSVTLWSLGNETGHGDAFRRAKAAVKAIDPSRPVHWERGNVDADVDSTMYPPVEWLWQRGKLGDEPYGSRTETRYAPDTNSTHTAGKPFFMCEYAHAMGNALGNFQEYWEAFYSSDSLSGGCIWDWIDQALWKETERTDPKTGKPERFLSYGGDFDEEPNDGPFNCNGVIDPERRVTAKLVEVGHVHRNLVVTRPDDGAGNGFAAVFELRNRFAFTRADEFLGVWRLRENGVVTKSGGFAPPALEPLSRCRFTVPGLAEALAASAVGAELFVDFEFSTTRDEPWAEKGWVVARDQVAIGKRWNFDSVKGGGDVAFPKVVEDVGTVAVEFGKSKAVFCRKSGTLCELAMAGRTILKGADAGPRLTCVRAFTDNDVWLRQPFYESGLTQLRHHARPIVVKDGAVRTVVEVTGSKSAGFTHTAVWRFSADGSMTMENDVVPHGTMPPALPRLGLSMKVSPDLNVAEWYGRGPRENYVDRRTGSFLGRWSCSVDELAEFYVRPQDNGFRGDVRWFSFANGDGSGIRLSASEPLFVQALRCGWEDLEFARHRSRRQRFRTPVIDEGAIRLNLDVRQLGLGGGSCGPKPMDKYIFPVEKTVWTLRFSPVR